MAPTTTPSATDLVRRLSDVAAVCDELGVVEVASLSVSDWEGVSVQLRNEDDTDTLADRLGLPPDNSRTQNYTRTGCNPDHLGSLTVYCGRSRPVCSCGQRCTHGEQS